MRIFLTNMRRKWGAGAALAAVLPFAAHAIEFPPDELVPSTEVEDIMGFYNVVCVATQWVVVFGLIIGALFIIYGGAKYITSGGDSSKSEDAKKMIITAVIGLVFLILATAIVRIVASFFGASNFDFDLLVSCGT